MTDSDPATDETWTSTTSAELADQWDLPEKRVRHASIAAEGVETVDGKHIEATTDGLVNLHRRAAQTRFS